MTSIAIVATFMGSTMFTMVYSATMQLHPGFVFFIMPIFYFVALLCLMYVFSYSADGGQLLFFLALFLCNSLVLKLRSLFKEFM